MKVLAGSAPAVHLASWVLQCSLISETSQPSEAAAVHGRRLERVDWFPWWQFRSEQNTLTQTSKHSVRADQEAACARPVVASSHILSQAQQHTWHPVMSLMAHLMYQQPIPPPGCGCLMDIYMTVKHALPAR